MLQSTEATEDFFKKKTYLLTLRKFIGVSFNLQLYFEVNISVLKGYINFREVLKMTNNNNNNNLNNRNNNRNNNNNNNNDQELNVDNANVELARDNNVDNINNRNNNNNN
ncbi:hypothetical protein [Alkalihalobacterium alkalinitrilicum]|uniref:hypothetical protein n=1 Tax=Alkalihalobacterium alkalinitrilicum TaxID=427920 RepID=UPI00114FD381|nr:hypothetical protein [Alkalihalobacterium alkalinitrilicum]